MSTAWRYPAPTSASSSTSQPTSFLAHLCSRNFHRRIICTRTSSPVTFAVVGDLLSDRIVLYCLPSGCSRYLALFLDGICRLVGVKLIAIDRPDSGATAPCPLEIRTHTTLCQTISVLQAEGLLDENLSRPEGKRPVAILAHSLGIFYALDLLCHFARLSEKPDLVHPGYRSLFGTRPLLLLSSPWVPTSVSRSSLALLPPGVVRLSSSVIPGIGKAVGMAMSSTGLAQDTAKTWLAWSTGVVRSEDEEPSQYRLHPSDERIPDPASQPVSRRLDEGRASSERKRPPASREVVNPFLSSVGAEPPASPTSRSGKKVRSEARQRWPHADFLPPHASHHKYTLDSRAYLAYDACNEAGVARGKDPPLLHPATGRQWKLSVGSGSRLIGDMMNAESRGGLVDDFLLCLGHAPGLGNVQLEEMIKKGIQSLREHGGADVTCVWATGDRLVPQRGRQWLDDLFLRDGNGAADDEQQPEDRHRTETTEATGGRISYNRLLMADAGHDATMSSEAVVVELLSKVKNATFGLQEGQERDVAM